MKTGTQKGVEEKIERGRGKIIGRKERNKKIQLHLWDSNPQPLADMDKGTTTRAKGEPEVVGRGSGSYPVEVHCYAAFLRYEVLKRWLFINGRGPQL